MPTRFYVLVFSCMQNMWLCACAEQQVMGFLDTDVAELLYANPTMDRATLTHRLCHKLTSTCTTPPPPVPKVSITEHNRWHMRCLNCFRAVVSWHCQPSYRQTRVSNSVVDGFSCLARLLLQAFKCLQ